MSERGFAPRWDNDAATIAGEMRFLLASLTDNGTEIEGGGGDNFYELWLKSGGEEYHLTVTKLPSKTAQRSG
jgi:hypothetical protein